MSKIPTVKSAVVKISKRERSIDSEFERESGAGCKKPKIEMATTIVNFVGSIEHFTAGDEFKDYVERMEHIFAINKTENEAKISLLVSLGGPELYRIIKLVAAPKKPGECTYAELIKALNNYFEPKRNTIGERFIFHRRQQGADETVSEFIVEIKSLSQTCAFDTNLETALRDKLIFGVRSTKIQRRLVGEKDITFDKACEMARMMEATENNLNEMQNGETVAAFSRDMRNKNNGKKRFSSG